MYICPILYIQKDNAKDDHRWMLPQHLLYFYTYKYIYNTYWSALKYFWQKHWFQNQMTGYYKRLHSEFAFIHFYFSSWVNHPSNETLKLPWSHLSSTSPCTKWFLFCKLYCSEWRPNGPALHGLSRLFINFLHVFLATAFFYFLAGDDSWRFK